MSEIIIRKMQPEDAVQVAKIEQEVFSIPWSEQSFRDAVQKELNIYFVACDADTIAGYIGAWGVFGEADITNVCVAPEYRRQGIAGKLLDALIEEGRLRGIGTFFLEVRESNASARSLYEKHGFKEIGMRKNFYEKPVENGIVMSRMFV